MKPARAPDRAEALAPEIVSMIKRLARQAARETQAVGKPLEERATVPADR